MNKSFSSARALPTVLILIAALAAGLGLWLGQRYFAAPTPPQLANALLYPTPRAIPDFELTQANGQPYTKADWQGRWHLVFFGFTHCPDVCPTTLAVLKQVWTQLGQQDLAGRLRVVFISVDPARDTPAQLGNYVRFFSPDFLAATGSDGELTKLTRALGLIYAHSVDANGNAQVDHSASVVLINPQAQLVGMFRPPMTAPGIVADLKTLFADGRH